MARRSGRRPGDSGTREAIRAAAIGQFSAQGYDRTSMRSVALEAGVDPALVSHYFGSKAALFADVVQLPFDPAQAVPLLFSGDRAQLGARVAQFLVTALDEPQARRRITSLVRAAATEPAAARMVRDLLGREIFARVAGQLDVADAHLRASLVGSQIVGLVMARYVIEVEPLASLPAAQLAAAIAPTLQRYLTEPLDCLP